MNKGKKDFDHEKFLALRAVLDTVLRCQNLHMAQRLVLHELVTLAQEEGYVFASNQFLADKFGISKTQVSEYISGLKEKGVIRIPDRDDGRRHIIIETATIYALEKIPNKRQSTASLTATHRDFFLYFQENLRGWRWSRELSGALKEYIELCKQKGKPLKKIQVKEQATYLIEHSGRDLQTAIKIIEQSIRKGWLGFHPLEVSF